MDRMKLIFKNRGTLMILPIVAAATITWNQTENNVLVFGLGGTVFALGWLLRLWCQLHLHYRLKVPKALTITGPYVYVRNPIYIANTAMLVGVVILTKLLWLAPLMIVYCAIVYTFVVRFEESHLLEKYGQPYADYIRQTPRWMPKFSQPMKNNGIDVSGFLIPSIIAEAPSLMLLLTVIIKWLAFWR